MRKLFVVSIVVLFGWLAVSLTTGTAQENKPKYTISQVMKNAHAKGKLRDKVTSGMASDEEKKQLVEYYEALAANKPPKGDEASWKEKTAALLAAAKEAAAGNTDALKMVNCAACHQAHKGK
jgi:mono/diheme cytochrome c family protein